MDNLKSQCWECGRKKCGGHNFGLCKELTAKEVTELYNNGKSILPLNRTQIIYALAQYAHPSWYHKLLDWPTEPLRALLSYYELPEPKGEGTYEKMIALKPIYQFKLIQRGIDVAQGPDRTVIKIFKLN